MELRAGIIEGFWSGEAAKLATWVVAQFTPVKSEELFMRTGNMKPSKSSLGRLVKDVSDRWEENREEHESSLRDAIVVPKDAASVAISLDGVLIPFDKPATTTDKSAKKVEEDSSPEGVPYREATCATVCFCDQTGEMLSAIRMAHAPETKKTTIKGMLKKTVEAVRKARPDLPIVKIADAAKDNWAFLGSNAFPDGPQVVDFYHASQHLNEAIKSVYGANTDEAKSKYEDFRSTLRHHKYGVGKVISFLQNLLDHHPCNKTVKREIAFFTKNRKRMRYAYVAERGMMIGSGVVEAACKTLVAQRLKRSGMRWSAKGAQAILTPRGWDQSDSFDKAWALVAATYSAKVTVLAHVINIRRSDERIHREKEP